MFFEGWEEKHTDVGGCSYSFFFWVLEVAAFQAMDAYF